MRIVIHFLIILGALNVHAADQSRPPLKSPFPSTVQEITIRNTHLVAKKQGVILRGMAPLSQSDVSELTNYGINEVLIFRNDVPGETGIATEVAMLNADKAITLIHQIPFKWKELTDFETPCRQTIQALKILKNAVESRGAGLFFHCTVGEDRTGYLAGLYRVIFEGQGGREAFLGEMCARGYAEGDPGKPDFVVADVHKNITDLYLRMLTLVDQRKISATNLNEAACTLTPALHAQLQNYRCK